MIFELPCASGSFNKRIGRLRPLTEEANLSWLQAISQFRSPNDAALRQKLDEVVRDYGECLILRRADARYGTGCSRILLKLRSGRMSKPWFARLPGKGRYAGVLGAQQMEIVDDRRVTSGSGLADTRQSNPPSPGTPVTYRDCAPPERDAALSGFFLRVRAVF